MNPGIGVSQNIDSLKLGLFAGAPPGANVWFAAVFGDSRDGIVVEMNGRIVEVNDACARLFGYASSIELVGRPVSVLSWSPQKEQLLVKRKDGSFLPLKATTVAVAPAGNSHHIIILREAATSPNPATQKLEVVGDLTKRAAHDLNNLLAAIRCQTELVLVYETVTPSVREMLQKVLTAVGRAAEITREWHDASGRQRI